MRQKRDMSAFTLLRQSARTASQWLDRNLGVTTESELPIVILAFVVSLQWLLILLQLFCRPRIRTMFDWLSP